MNLRTLLKSIGAVATAPLAWLWPKRAEGEPRYHDGELRYNNVFYGCRDDNKPLPEVKMTTWWWRVEFPDLQGRKRGGEWLFESVAADCRDCGELFGQYSWYKVAHYCEWSEVLDESDLHEVKMWKGKVRRCLPFMDAKLLRYISGAQMT